MTFALTMFCAGLNTSAEVSVVCCAFLLEARGSQMLLIRGVL